MALGMDMRLRWLGGRWEVGSKKETGPRQEPSLTLVETRGDSFTRVRSQTVVHALFPSSSPLDSGASLHSPQLTHQQTMWSRVVNVVSVLFVVPRFMLSTGSHHCPLHLHSPSCISHRPFRIIADSRLPSHNPAASASFDALILLRKAQLYNRTTNPRPVEFTLDVVQPPQGMTNQQQMAIQTILQQQMLDKMRAKGGEVPSDPS